MKQKNKLEPFQIVRASGFLPQVGFNGCGVSILLVKSYVDGHICYVVKQK
jgi:hypothetical protein